MSKLIKTKKGFTIIRLSHEEAVGIWGEYGGLGICIYEATGATVK